MHLLPWLKTLTYVALFPLALPVMLSAGALSEPSRVERLSVEIVAEYPHDTGSYTQGLVYDAGTLYESTGQYGQSRVRKIQLSDAKVMQEARLSPFLFGEGLALDGDRLVQITWRSGVAIVYDRKSLRELSRLRYKGEGWGLTTDGTWFVMSDGSSALTFRDPATFAVWRRLPVTLEGRPVDLLNELEFVDGQIYANVWHSTDILRIDPSSGKVTAVIDASRLPYRPKVSEDVLNGIAYIPEKGTFLLTGKLWPRIYEVRFH